MRDLIDRVCLGLWLVAVAVVLVRLVLLREPVALLALLAALALPLLAAALRREGSDHGR